MREGSHVLLQAIGAGAVNQAMKALVIARGFLSADGLEVICVPEFVVVDIDAQERTAVRFHVDRPGSAFPPATAIAKQATPADTPPDAGAGSGTGRLIQR
jgi:stage V sporulation protein S